MLTRISSGFASWITGKAKPPVQPKADPFLEKYPSIRGDTKSDLEKFPKVTFGSEPVHLQMGMHPGVSQLFQRQRRGPFI